MANLPIDERIAPLEELVAQCLYLSLDLKELSRDPAFVDRHSAAAIGELVGLWARQIGERLERGQVVFRGLTLAASR
jgi:hypothetical protein